jgi:hypothetical protein
VHSACFETNTYFIAGIGGGSVLEERGKSPPRYTTKLNQYFRADNVTFIQHERSEV